MGFLDKLQQGNNQNNVQNTSYTQDTPVQKTSYQQNLAKPVQQNTNWYKGAMPTTTEVYGRIKTISQYDPNKAMDLATRFTQAQQTVGSPWYNPYLKATNQAVDTLKAYGVNPADLTDEWFQTNTEWQKHLRYGNTTNTPQSPMSKKNATDQEKLAYSIYQYWYSMDQTKKAQEQAKALREEVAYKANDPNHNWSDDEIKNSIDWEKKYSTLGKARAEAAAGRAMEFNDAIAFSDDDINGWIWAARNNGGTGNVRGDMAMYALGEGNVWKDNPELAAKWNWNDKNTYRPYQAGMTLDPEVGLYFGVYSFDQRTLEKLRYSIDPNDETSMEMYQKAAKAWENTQKAIAQRDKIYEWVDKNIGKSYEWIEKNLDKRLGESEYSMLKAMDDSIENGSKLVELTGAVDYSRWDLLQYVKDKQAQSGDRGTAADIASGATSFMTGKAKSAYDVQQEAEDILRRNHITNNADDSTIENPVGSAEEAYDSVYGTGAYQRDLAAADSYSSAAQAQRDSDAYVNDTVGAFENNMNNYEAARLNGYSGASDQAKVAITEKKNEYMSGAVSPDLLIQKNTASMTKGYIQGVLGVYGKNNKFEKTQSDLAEAKTNYEELKTALGVKAYYGMENDPSFTMEIDGSRYKINMSPDMSGVQSIENVTNENFAAPVYANFEMYSSPEEYDSDTRIWDEVRKSGKVEEFAKQFLENEANIEAANQLEITDEEKQAINLMREYEIRIEDDEKYIADNQADYDRDLAEFKRQQERRAVHVQNLKDMGIETGEVETADAVLDYLTSFSDYEATRWDAYNPTYTYSMQLANGMSKEEVFAGAKAEYDEMQEQIKDIEWAKDYIERNKIDVPADYIKNMDRRIAKIQRDIDAFNYFSIQFNENFDNVVEAQRLEEYDQRARKGILGISTPYDKMTEEEYFNKVENGVLDQNEYPSSNSLVAQTQGLSHLMSKEEKDTWYYLKAFDELNGTKKADEYFDFLSNIEYGVLTVRQREETESLAEGMTNDNFLYANAGAVVMSPLNALTSTVYNIYQTVTGEEFNPNSPLLTVMHFRTKTREQSAKNILKTFGKQTGTDANGEPIYEETTLSKIAQGGYEILTNRADSLANSMAFGWLFSGVKGKILNELLSATPMGISAATEAVAKAKERGATDEQAYLVSAFTLVAETFTEAISLENMSAAFESGVTARTAKEFLKNWLTKAGVSEMFGESVNDIVENLADELIMGEMSDHADRVYEYRMKGYTKDEAEYEARKEEIKGVLHTALISYLSPGLDVVQYARGRYHYYGEMTRALQETETANMSIRDVRRGIRAEEKRIDQEYRDIRKGKTDTSTKQTGPVNTTATETTAETGATAETAVTPETATTETETKTAPKVNTEQENSAKQFTVDFEILESAKNYDKAGQQAAVASVIDEGGTQDSADLANATSVHLAEVFGEGANIPGEMQDLFTGAKVSNVDHATIKQGLQYAALGGEQSVSRQVVQSEAYKAATPDAKATMLAEAVQQDAQNDAVREAVTKTVHEDRVAKQMGVLISQGAAEAIGQAQVKVDFAELDAQKARKTLKTQQDVEQSAREAMQRAAAESVANPGNKALSDAFEKALTELKNQAKVTQEYEQHLANMEKAEQTARQNADKVKQKTLTSIRQQAEAAVAQEDQARSQQAVQEQAAQEQAKVEQEQEKVTKEKERVLREAIDNATRADAEAFIDQFPEMTEADKEFVRKRFQEKQMQRQKAQKTQSIGDIRDENGNLTEEAREFRNKAVKAISKKFEVGIVFANTEEVTKDGKKFRSNGFYDEQNHRIVLDENLSLDEAMHKVLPHELLHMAEKSQAYGSVVNALFNIMYGSDADINQALLNLKKNNGKPTTKLESAIVHYKRVYDQTLGKNHTYEYAAQELAADKMGQMIYDPSNPQRSQELINRLVAEQPNTSKIIMNSFKTMIKRAFGMKGAWLTNAQKTVDMFEYALSHPESGIATTDTGKTEGYTFEDGDAVRFADYGRVNVYVRGALQAAGMRYANNGLWENPNGVSRQEINNIIKGANEAYYTFKHKRFSLDETQVIAENNDGEALAEELPGGTVALNTDKRYSLSSFTEDEQARVRQALIDSGRFTETEVDQYIEDALGVASIIASDRGRLDYTADPGKTMLKPNAEYVKTLDASTLCAKRLLYQGTFDAIQHLLPNTPLMPEDLIDLANLMREMGYETPCGICYVESRRRQLGKFTEEWLSKYDGEYKPTIDEVTTSDGLEKLRQEHPQAYEDFVKAMNKKGTMNPKVVQLRTDYRGEIRDMTPGQIQKVKDIGGLRIQSFSDFETPHLLDMMQAVMDMSAKGLTAQAYTKVPNFPWAFGDTGIKINLSLIGKGTGLDADGHLVFDDVEGMPFEEAMKLRERYSKNVGTILVGINDEHILAAMADPRIDFIIPFHKSGWSKTELERMPVLNSYSDYTDSQNEKAIVGRNKDGSYKTESLEKSKRVNFQPVGENGYWDFTKSGKENAEAYLEMCAKDGRLPKFSQFLVDNGDGSFSLQPDGSTDGYWKTLIDFKMYDNDGNGAPQQEVTPNVNMPEAQRILSDYTLERNGISRESNDDLPVAQPVVDRYVEEYKAKHPLDETRKKYSLPSDAPYLAAVERGEMDVAQEEVDSAASKAMPNSVIRDESGKLITVYHGTSEQFTTFDMSKGRSTMDIQGSFFSPYEIEAGGYGENVGKYYLNITNPAPEGIAYQTLNKYKGQNEAGIKAREDLIKMGYDGVQNYDEYIAFYPEQIKSADPVTYDDQGRVIPLSERFDTGEKDIRYSLPSDDILDEQIDMYLDNGGIMGDTIYDRDQALVEDGILTQDQLREMQKTDQGKGRRQWGENMAQEIDEISERARQYVLDHDYYTTDTNRAQLDRAIDWVKKLSTPQHPDAYQEALQKVTAKNFNFRSADGQAKMAVVMGMAVAKGDTTAQVMLADAINKQGTALGQALQARKLFRLMTPEGRMSTLQKMLTDQQQALEKKGIQKDLKFSDWVMQAAGLAENEGEFKAVQAAAAYELAQQIPASWKDRFNTVRMLSMLANPRTHIRNLVGNFLFVPAVGIKNKLGALMELGVEKGERTKTLAPILSKDIRDFAKQDANNMKDVLTGEAKFSEGTQIKQNQAPLGKFVKKLSDLNGGALETEDWLFLKGHYRRALGGWMQANGYTVEQVKNDPGLLEKGRAYAIEEAQKATYRDFNKTAQILNEVSRKGGVAGFIVDAALPFKKTPANILRRGLEYSPIGIAKGLWNLSQHMKEYTDYQEGKIRTLPDKAVSPAQVIDQICSGLSGTAVMALGFLLAGCGAVSCGLDDDEDKFGKAKGEQEYAIKLFGKDVSYTMDWAAPMSMPFFVGAAVRGMSGDGDYDIDEVVNAFGNISEPVFNLSMLDGINTLFKTSQYDDTNTLTQIFAKIGTNYVSSYVPSLLGAVARIADDKQRKAFVEQGKGTGVMGTVRYSLEQMQNKIPGLNQQNIAVRDIWGEEKTSSLAERIIENLISPGYINTVKDDPILDEMARLYDATGDTAMIPDEDPDKTISYTVPTTKERVKHVLTDKEWDRYKEVRNKTAHAGLTELINNADYQRATDAVQVAMIKSVWSYADKVGKNAVIPDIEVASENVSALAKDSKITGYKNEMIKALNAGDYDAYDTMVQALYDAEVEESEIKTKIGNTYRDMYKAAYRNGDTVRMAEIEELLDYTGFDFDYEKWQDQVDEKYGDSGLTNIPIRTTASSGISDVGPRKRYEGMEDYKGTINIDNRPVIYNDDGSITTEESFSTNIDGKEVLLPTVINGRRVSIDEAIDHYIKTGEHLGIFDTPEDAEEYAIRLHNRQDWFYHR